MVELWRREGGLDAPMTQRSFFDVAERDFRNRLVIKFAVRLDGQFIAHAVLFNFDYRGGAEPGLRILPAFDGRAYASEAATDVTDWELC